MKWIGVALTAVVLITGCSDESSVDGAEQQIEEAFLTPLTAAGISFEVISTCHLGESEGNDKWQFEARVVVDAGSDVVRSALADTVGVIRTDRDPMIVQQHVGEPGRGWDGVLISNSTDSSTLGLTRNNVIVGSERPPIGWLPVCDS